MAFVNIENAAISVQLGYGEILTVPTGETWKVTINGAYVNSSTETRYVAINDIPIIYPGVNNVNSSINCFLVGGDVVKTNGTSNNPVYAHISGFVVQQQQ